MPTPSRGLLRPVSAPRSTEPVDGEDRSAPVRRVRFRIVRGPQEGTRFETTDTRCVLGTHPTANVRLDDRTVSRFHCELSLGATHVDVRDLGSLNGTRVDGVTVERARLHDGAHLAIGSTELEVSFADEPSKVLLSDRVELGGMVGVSAAMRRTFALLERAARSTSTVLLTGETGTGKEVAAEALHQLGPRAAAPFVVIDCGALAPTLLESELFGHERGAFTGAEKRRIGAFEAANGGTVLLDEIGELPLDLQPKLLRVLEQRRVRRLGSNETVEVDVRVLAATNRDLRVEVNAHRFRSDLYYRLAVVEVELPPLRERREDIPALAQRLAEGRASPATISAALRTPAFLGKLRHHDWPGNVRELRNEVERALALAEPLPPRSDSDVVPAGPALAPLAVDATADFKLERDRWLLAFERSYLEGLLAAHDDNVSAAARTANLDRVHLYRLLWKHGLR